MTGLLISLAGAYGVFLLYSAATGAGDRGATADRSWACRRRIADWLAQAGLADVRPLEFTLVAAALGLAGTVLGYALFAGAVPALLTGAFAATFPFAWYRDRREQRRAESQDAWPRMIEQLRVLTGAVGRSVPQALFEVGTTAPPEMQPAFDSARREWMLSTDFERALIALKAAGEQPGHP